MLEGDPCAIVENEFVKPGKGQAFNRQAFSSSSIALRTPFPQLEVKLRSVRYHRRKHGLYFIIRNHYQTEH